ncbi:hypothetical protein EV643_12589 [Kribbella sp. VKM Ac-2527]|uniref:Uncharacterized protein n=1 Tax=Kribbella caucasensis TaxID=2512215 RepID=A0A4R6JGL1_9ACTN|nr:hypothetical protein EV643_12589 [Kribbella sp. VKM Ac-2527]
MPVDPMVLSALKLPSSDPAPGEEVVSAAELDRLRRARRSGSGWRLPEPGRGSQ